MSVEPGQGAAAANEAPNLTVGGIAILKIDEASMARRGSMESAAKQKTVHVRTGELLCLCRALHRHGRSRSPCFPPFTTGVIARCSISTLFPAVAPARRHPNPLRSQRDALAAVTHSHPIPQLSTLTQLNPLLALSPSRPLLSLLCRPVARLDAVEIVPARRAAEVDAALDDGRAQALPQPGLLGGAARPGRRRGVCAARAPHRLSHCRRVASEARGPLFGSGLTHERKGHVCGIFRCSARLSARRECCHGHKYYLGLLSCAYGRDTRIAVHCRALLR